MKYFSEDSKNGDIGNFFYGNSHFFEFNEYYFIKEDLVLEKIPLGGGGSSGMEEPQPQYPVRMLLCCRPLRVLPVIKRANNTMVDIAVPRKKRRKSSMEW
jgi:hypothetical protein